MLENYIVPLQHIPLVAYDAGAIDWDQAAADVARFPIPFKCIGWLSGLLITEACAGTTQGEVKFDKRPTLGSDTNRTDGTFGYFKGGTTPLGKALYKKTCRGLLLVPGDEVIVEITVRPVTAAAGHFIPFLLVKPAEETIANLPNMVLSA